MCHGKVFYGRGALCVRRGPFSRYRQYAPAAGRSGVARPYRPSARPASRSVGRPVAVNSGYRSPALNAAVGGAPRSRHMYGEAADITVGSPSANAALFALLESGGFDFDQLIDERGYAWRMFRGAGRIAGRCCICEGRLVVLLPDGGGRREALRPEGCCG